VKGGDAACEWARTRILLYRARRGDRIAFGELVRRTESRLAKSVARRVGSVLRRYLDGEDILQETYLEALELIREADFENFESLLAWLRRIALYKVQEALRRYRAMKESSRERELEELLTSGELDVAAHGALQEEWTSFTERLEWRDMARRVFLGLARLPEDYRDVVFLRGFFRASWATIADVMGRESQGAVRKLYARGCVELIKLLHE